MARRFAILLAGLAAAAAATAGSTGLHDGNDPVTDEVSALVADGDGGTHRPYGCGLRTKC